jgi:hypothetical protein
MGEGNKLDDLNSENKSILGRLLEELSWEGSTIKKYRDGGRGYENVLTTEVFQSLDFLPRNQFLGEVIKSALGADKAREILVTEIEQANLCILPGNHYLIPSGKSHQTKLSVQPDGLIETNHIYGLIEAKRIRSSSFQKEQLAREFVLALRESGNRTPLLILVLGKEPPVSVQSHGRKTIKDAIELYIESVLKRTEGHSITKEEALSKVNDVVCWITWDSISRIVASQKELFTNKKSSLDNCIVRLSDSVINSIDWHK